MGRKLFVGNLSFETSETDMRALFSTVGTCESAAVPLDRMTGRSRGFGFVEMATEDEARRAISELHGRELQGRAINVSEARERSERPFGGGGFRNSAPRDFGADLPPAGGRFRKDGGSRRGLRAKKRSL
jgi:RNA recognition motif-containing protein